MLERPRGARSDQLARLLRAATGFVRCDTRGLRIERIESAGDRATWALAGDSDLFRAGDVAWVLDVELEAHRDVVLDLSDVTLFESTALGVLIGATKRASSRHARVALRTNASQAVLQVLDATDARDRLAWVDADDDGPAGVREPRRPRPSGGAAAADAS